MYPLGGDGYYFLTNDSNDVIAQTQGKLKFSSRFLNEVAERHEERVAFAGGIGALYFHVVAPNKETVLNHLLPSDVVFERRGPIPLRKYLRSHRCVSRFTQFRPEVLRGNAHLAPTYSRTDTHWTTYGALAYLRDFAHRFQIEPLIRGFQTLHIEIVHSTFKGDLAVHADLPEESYAAAKILNPLPEFDFEGNLVNEGLIVHGRTNNPNARGRALIIHDSFAYALRELFFHSFQEVLLLHSPDIDLNFTKAFAPDYIIFIQAERFFPRLLQNDIVLTERLARFAAAKHMPDTASSHIEQIVNAPNSIKRGPTDLQRAPMTWKQRLGLRSAVRSRRHSRTPV